jgi:copper transport protein
MRTRRLPRLIAGAALAAVLVIALAAPAWAHATLESSNPASDSQLDRAPTQITLSFSEAVSISPRSVQLFSCAGGRATLGEPKHGAKSSQVNTSVDSALDPGRYLVVWRVISADSHPVDGAFYFTVGGGSGSASCAAAANATSTSSSTVGDLFGVMRFLLFSGLALLIGGMVFLVVIARGTTAAPRTRVLVWIGWVLTAVTTIFSVMLQGPYAAGTGIGDAFKWSVINDVLGTRYGHIALWRLLFVVVAVPLILYERRASEQRPLPWTWSALAVVDGLLLAATPGLAGHASTGTWTDFAVPLDTLHVAAMCIWFGGLAALVVTAIGGGFSGGLRRALVRFSTLALSCVVVLVITGLFASWRQVSFHIKGYTSTSYGNMLLIKLAIVLGLVALAAVSRSIVQRRRAAPLDAPDSAVAAIDEQTVSGLRRSVGAEVALGVAVLIVTALLVNAAPARSALQPKLFAGSAVASAGSQQVRVKVTIDPAAAGPNTIHVYTQKMDGTPQNVREMSATMSLPSEGIDGLKVGIQKAGPDHYKAENQPISPSGKWKLTVFVLLPGSFVQAPAVLDVPIR